MIGRILQIASAASLIVATAVMAQPPGAAAGRGDPNKQICRATVDTGSRLSRSRACHTAQEWAELRRQTQQNVDHIQNSRAWNTCPPPGTTC